MKRINNKGDRGSPWQIPISMEICPKINPLRRSFTLAEKKTSKDQQSEFVVETKSPWTGVVKREKPMEYIERSKRKPKEKNYAIPTVSQMLVLYVHKRNKK